MDMHTHLRNLSRALNELQTQNQFCDIVINVGGRAFNAHKAVLASCSSYFTAMFTSGFKESTQSKIDIEGKAEIFEVLLEFAYTGILKVTAKTAYDILEMACYMQFTDACASCATNLENNYMQINANPNGRRNSFSALQHTRTRDKLSIADAFKVHELAKCHDDLKKLANLASKFLCHNLPEMKKSDVFLQNASVAFVRKFLKKGDLPTDAHEEKDVS